MLVFENDGLIDIRSIKTFGVSVKEKEDAIGFFGTGLKYAIAIFLRNNHKLSLIVDCVDYTFELKNVSVRGKSFDVVTMNGEELSFTSHLGTNWELWQAFREVYCNCLDEGGKISLGRPAIFEPGKTYFLVEGPQAENLYHDRNSVVLKLNDDLLVHEGKINIYNTPSKYLYYRGIRVYDLHHNSRFTYDIRAESVLTEDRTLRNTDQVFGWIPQELATFTNKHLIREVLNSEDTFESHLSFYGLIYADHVSAEFLEVLKEEWESNNTRVSKSAIDYYIRKHGIKTTRNFAEVKPSVVQAKQLDRATKAIKEIWPDFNKFPLLIVDDLGPDTMAMADMTEKRMLVSQRCFEHGTKYLTSTLVEEFFHLKTGYGDHTRQLQTYLFDQLCTMIENHVIKEPL